jgi:lysozyme
MPTQSPTVGKAGLDLIKSFEGLYLKAYLCPANVPTIGYGSITWPDGKKIELGQQVDLQTAEKLLMWEVNKKAVEVAKMAPGLNQNQFDSLVSFAYNLGTGALKSSTLLKKVKANPNDPTIRDEFNKWNRGGGKVLKGLVRRRKAEADLYFKPI